MKYIYHYFNQLNSNDVWRTQKGYAGWYDKSVISDSGTPVTHMYYCREDNDEPLRITPSMEYKDEWTLGDDDIIFMY